jgi:hypothetical protein
MNFLERFANLPENLSQYGFNADIKNAKIEPLNECKVFIIKCFIEQNFEKRKNINHKHTSYELKHFVENQLGFYISNGEFIGAMILDNFDYKNTRSIVNCCFNIKITDLILWPKDDYLETLKDFVQRYEMQEELLLMFNIEIELEERKLLNSLQNESR